MKDFINELKWNKIVYGAILVVVGLILFLFPGQISEVISMVVGLFFLFMGIVVIVTYLTKRVEMVFGSNRLVIGAAFITLGIFVMRRADFVVSIIPFILGLIVLVSGVNKLQSFIDLKRLHSDGGIVTLVFAILNIVFGVVLIINPFDAAIVLLKVTGIALMFSGVTDLVATFILQKQAKDYMVNKADRFMQDSDIIDAEFEEADK